MREALAGRVVLITGASAGIGEALAREVVARGARVVLVARRAERLEALARELGAARALAIAGDVTRDGDLEAAVDLAREAFGGVDVAVANAGFGVEGSFERLDLADYRRQLETNVFGVLRTARAALPALKARRGVFVVVGSVAGYLAPPHQSAYAMSKYAVRAFCDAVRHEWAPLGVGVVHVAPGFIATEIRRLDRAGALRDDRPDPIPAWLMMDAARAAREVADGIEARATEVVLTHHGRLGILLARLAPRLTRALLGLGARRAMTQGAPTP